MEVTIILLLVILVNGMFAVALFRDVLAHRATVLKEPGNPVIMSICQFFMYFLSTFGISDFAMGAALYPKAKWLSEEKLPGTLNTACVIPVAVMALAYISSIKVGLLTLVVPIIAQIVGAYISPRFVVKLPVTVIKKFVITGLLVAALVILASKFGLYPSGGNESSLSGGKLLLLGLLSLIYGAMNNIGIGSYALTMATVYALGLNPAVAFPIMMGSCTFSVPIGSMQFVKLDAYSRKITLFSSIFGVIGVLIAVFVVKSLDVSTLQWIVVAVILYSAVSMLMSLQTKKK